MKKLDEKELKDVNGGTLAPVSHGIYKCNSCGEVFDGDPENHVCTKCHSTNTVPVTK